MALSPGKFVWHELFSSNVDKSKKFWTSLLGWESEAMTMGDDTPYLMVGPKENMLLGVLSLDMLPDGVPPHFLGYMSVEDVDASAKAVAANGGQIMKEGFDVP
ncbi:MAG: VOC family protein, partial [Actinomycetia bacterium]|nr:VOC family protein [Actinomycetes bacterium]